MAVCPGAQSVHQNCQKRPIVSDYTAGVRPSNIQCKYCILMRRPSTSSAAATPDIKDYRTVKKNIKINTS